MEAMSTPELPVLDEFDVQFRRKYGRYLTAEERKFFLLAEHLLKYPPRESRPAKKPPSGSLVFLPVGG